VRVGWEHELATGPPRARVWGWERERTREHFPPGLQHADLPWKDGRIRNEHEGTVMNTFTGLIGTRLRTDAFRSPRAGGIGWLLVLLVLPVAVAQPGPARGYTIPIVDLSGDAARQVVVDREPGQYLGHPTTVLLEDNKTMIAVYPKGHGRGAIVMKRSTDGGLTWSERLDVPENWATSQEVPTIYRVVDKAGVKRLIMFSGLYPIRMAVSEDDGQTWSPLEPIGEFGGIVAMASVVRLKNGDYMALFHDDGRFLREDGKAQTPPVFVVYKTLSTDGGLTWSEPEAIASHPSAHLCEPGAVRSPDGNQIAVLLRENSRKMNSFVIFSNDEGQTWSEAREVPGALTGDRHTARYAPDGRLFISFRDTTLESPTRGDWVGWVGRYEDIVEGREGRYRVRIMDNHKGADCAYPAVELLPDGTFVTTTYGHWTPGEEPYIVSVRFTMDELDAIAAGLPESQVLFKQGDGGVAVYRIPGLEVTNNGVVVAIADARADRGQDLPNNIDIVMRRSTDSGETWSDTQTIVDFPGKAGGGDAALLVDRTNNRLWMFYVYAAEGIGTKTSQPGLGEDTLRLHLMHSDDDGATWSEARDITADLKDPSWEAVWSSPGRGYQDRAGRLYFPFSRRGGGETCSTYAYSDDHGETWQRTAEAGSNVNESMLIERADGSLLANMRSSHGKNFRAIAYSYDRGQSWCGFHHHTQLVEPQCQASLIWYSTVAGGADQNRLLFSNPGSTERQRMTIRLSYDEGDTWPVERVLHEGPTAYSCMAVLPDGSIGILYECGEDTPYRTITFAKFTLAWLTGGLQY
jgi:hypothetical protein